jgi:hypothetical protein
MSRRLNVQQQNNLTFEAMLSTARHYREIGLAIVLTEFFDARGIDVDESAIVWAQTDGYMLGFPHGLGGLLVTPNKTFIEFELEMNAEHTKVTHVHEYSDVTAKQNMSNHNRGIGRGYGALAVAVLEALNAT